MLTVHRLCVNHIKMLLKRRVHESDSVLFELIIRQCFRLLFKPLNLTSSNTIIANLSNTILEASTQEPNPGYFSRISIVCFDWDFEVKAVLDLLAQEDEIVGDVSVQGISI